MLENSLKNTHANFRAFRGFGWFFAYLKITSNNYCFIALQNESSNTKSC
jgi:hypothetical protein